MEFSFQIVDKVDPVAAYAAVIATLVALWDIIKWWNSGPKLQGSARLNMRMFGSYTPEDQNFVAVDVYNAGDRPTTIRGVYIHGYASWWKRLRDRPKHAAVVNRSILDETYPLPYALDVGSEYRAIFEQTDEFMNWAEETRLYVVVVYAGGKALFLRVKVDKDE